MNKHNPDKPASAAPPRRILRLAEVRKRLSIGRTMLDEKYIKTGRLKLIKLGKRAVGVLESNVEEVIDELLAESN
jgi:predicted DNA-binding transcriptional regulator AlpA